jgi:hypothetical protein
MYSNNYTIFKRHPPNFTNRQIKKIFCKKLKNQGILVKAIKHGKKAYLNINTGGNMYLIAKIMAAHPHRKINGQYRRLYYRGIMPHKL